MGDVLFPINATALINLVNLTAALLIIFPMIRIPLKRKYHYVFIGILIIVVTTHSTHFFANLSDSRETYAGRVWWTWLVLFFRDPSIYLFTLLFVGKRLTGITKYTLLGVWGYALIRVGMLFADFTLIYTLPRITPLGFASGPGTLTPYFAPFGIEFDLIVTAVLAPSVLIQYYRSQGSSLVRSQVLYLITGTLLLAVAYLGFSLGRYFGGINPRPFVSSVGFMIMLVGLRKHGFFTITPTVEEALSKVPLRYYLTQGSAYLAFETEPKQAFEVFSNLAQNGHYGLCITRFPPNNTRESYGLKTTPILWLTEEKSDDGVAPSDLHGLLVTIKAFLQKAERSVIMLHGLEYLISVNGFRPALRLIVRLNDLIVQKKGILLVPILPKSLNEKQLTFLSAECPSLQRLEVSQTGEAITSPLQPLEELHPLLVRNASSPAEPRIQETAAAEKAPLQFKREDASKAFLSLAKAFLADYTINRVSIDSAGWRTSLEIAEETKLPAYRMYGKGGQTGSALVELFKRGLVETRYFPGQRGRGGTVMKIRVNYANPYVKEELDRIAKQP